MKKLCLAVGINREITDINEFLNRELNIKVKVDEYEYNGETRRAIKSLTTSNTKHQHLKRESSRRSRLARYCPSN